MSSLYTTYIIGGIEVNFHFMPLVLLFDPAFTNNEDFINTFKQLSSTKNIEFKHVSLSTFGFNDIELVLRQRELNKLVYAFVQ